MLKAKLELFLMGIYFNNKKEFVKNYSLANTHLDIAKE